MCSAGSFLYFCSKIPSTLLENETGKVNVAEAPFPIQLLFPHCLNIKKRQARGLSLCYNITRRIN